MTARTARRPAFLAMSEGELLANIRGLAAFTNWLIYHTHDSRRSEPGFPDTVLVSSRQRRVIFAELKDAKRKTTPEQDDWLAALAAAGMETAVWRPQQWRDGTIERALKGERLGGEP